MSKKWSQFDPFTALTGTEEIVGLQGGTNKRGAANGVFKTFFDSLYWPLGGAADLTAHTTVDGNSFDLSFGDPNPLNSFDVSVIENFHFHSDDGTYHAHIEIVNEALNHYLQLLFTDGTEVTSVTMQDNLLTLIADDGVDNSSITFSPLNAIFNLADAGQFAIRDEAAADILVVTEDLTTVIATDGVDSSSLSLTPLGLSFDFLSGGITELNGDWNIANTAQAHSVIFGPDYLTTFDPLATFYAEAENIQLVSDIFYLAAYSGVEIRALTNNGVSLVVNDNESNEILKCEEIGGLRYTTITGLIKLPSYITANLPTVSEGGLFAFCTDEVGGEVPVFTNNSGTWLKVMDGSPPVGP